MLTLSQALLFFQILLIYFVNKIEKNPCPHGICIHVVKGDNELARKNVMSNGAECYENNKAGRIWGARPGQSVRFTERV